MGRASSGLIVSLFAASEASRFATKRLVETTSGVLYYFFGQRDTAELLYIKSTDGGVSWSPQIFISLSYTVSYIATYYDGDSGLNSELIHVALTTANTSDVMYFNLNTSNDSISSIYTVFVGASAATGGALSITRTRGGNLICGGCIDSGAELFCYKSTNVGVNWSSIAAVYEAANDQMILLPGWAADNQDAMCLYFDNSANEISRKLYDDSANSWSETSVATSIYLPLSSTTYPNFSATIDLINSQNILVAWTNVDTLNADLLCWKITESAITGMTDVVTNSVDDQGVCSITINSTNNYLYVFYGGKSDGSETYESDFSGFLYGNLNVYYKISQDLGTTWGAETKLSKFSASLHNIYSQMRTIYSPMCIVYDIITPIGTTKLAMNYIFFDNAIPRATYQLGM